MSPWRLLLDLALFALAALYLSYLAWLFRGRAAGRSGVIKAVFVLD